MTDVNSVIKGNVWRLCHERPDVQAMLDEAVKQPVGANQHSKQPLYNIQTLDEQQKQANSPAGNSRAAGLRKLRKHAMPLTTLK
jgi:hypothetical protein